MTPGPVPRLLMLFACALAGAWGFVGLALAVTNSPAAVFTAGFEAVIAGAAAVGFDAARRRRDGLAMTLACVAGTVFVGSVLGYIAAGAELHGRSMTAWTAGRAGLAGVLAVLAAWAVLGVNPRAALPRLGLGLALAVPVAALGAAVQTGLAQRVLDQLPGLARLGVLFVLFVVALGLISASVDLVIRAFATGPRQT